MKSTLNALVLAIIADSIVDADEVEQLRTELYADGKIDKDEAEALFKINDAVSGNENDASYEKLFVDAITSYVLEDEETPGVVDEEEGAWLVSKLESDGQIDDLERKLLMNISEKATSIESPELTALIDSLK